MTATALRPTVELRTNDAIRVLRLEQIEKYRDCGTECAYACRLIVHSGDFGAVRQFYFDEYHLRSMIENLAVMDNRLVGEAILKYRHEHDYLKLQVNSLGHVQVAGELFEDMEPWQHLIWAFRTDQTVLDPLRRDLQSLI